MRAPRWLLITLVAIGSFGVGLTVWALTSGPDDSAGPSAVEASASRIPTESGAASATPSDAASLPPSASGSPSPTSRATPTPVPRPTPEATPAPPVAAFALSTNAFGPVKLPARVDAALAAVTPRLGPPSDDETGPGCEFAGPNRAYRTVEWGDLRLAGDYEGSSVPMFSSWSVDGTNLPAGVTLPYGVTVGTSYAKLQAAVPDHAVDDEHMFNEGLIITKDSLWWFLDKKNTVVTEIVANPLLCE